MTIQAKLEVLNQHLWGYSRDSEVQSITNTSKSDWMGCLVLQKNTGNNLFIQDVSAAKRVHVCRV